MSLSFCSQNIWGFFNFFVENRLLTRRKWCRLIFKWGHKNYTKFELGDHSCICVSFVKKIVRKIIVHFIWMIINHTRLKSQRISALISSESETISDCQCCLSSNPALYFTWKFLNCDDSALISAENPKFAAVLDVVLWKIGRILFLNTWDTILTTLCNCIHVIIF